MSKSSDLPQNVTEAIVELVNLKEAHHETTKNMLESPIKTLFMVDLFAVATLNRSLGLLVGFCHLIEMRNFVSAAPLIRLQLDNVLRFSALNLVKRPQNLASKVYQGEQINKIKDSDGKKMTDRYLVNKLAEKHSWIDDVYKGTSGYVHLSEKHFYNAINLGGEDIGTMKSGSMKISEKDMLIPENVYLEAINTFDEITRLLIFSYIAEWVKTRQTLI